MPGRHRSHSAEFRRQVVAAHHGRETLHALARRRELTRNLIRIWVEKAQVGALGRGGASADPLTAHEARIAALERLVGRLALEIEFFKGGVRSGHSRRSAPTSAASPSGGDAS